MTEHTWSEPLTEPGKAALVIERAARKEAERRANAAERELAETRAKEQATQRALWRARMIAAGCAVLAVAAVASAIFGYVSLQNAHKANLRADAVRGQAENLVGYMMTDLQPALEQYGRLPLLRGLTEQAVRYFDSLPADLRDVDTDRQHAAALRTLAFILDDVGDRAGAGIAYGKSVALME